MIQTLVKRADRMMTSASATEAGIEMTFADGQSGVIPFAAIPEASGLADVRALDLPNPYELILRTARGERLELPWDFARHYCDASYRPRVEAAAATGRRAIGGRIRSLRAATGLTQTELAAAAQIGRVTLARIESGEQSPRFETLAALAQALRLPVRDLLADPISPPFPYPVIPG